MLLDVMPRTEGIKWRFTNSCIEELVSRAVHTLHYYSFTSFTNEVIKLGVVFSFFFFELFRKIFSVIRVNRVSFQVYSKNRNILRFRCETSLYQ